MSSAPSVVGREKELKLPIGVLFGEDDEILDAKLHGEKFSELTGAELKILPNRGHMLPLTEPEECAEFIHGIMKKI